MSRRACIAATALLSSISACAFDAGQGFARLGDGELAVSLDIENARRVDADTFRTDRGYEVTLSALSLRVRHVRFEERLEGAEGEDPAASGSCHDDHCHAGGDVQADEPESSAEYVTRAQAPVGRTLNALEGDEVAFKRFDPTRELSMGTLGRAEVSVTSMRLEAEIRGADLKAPWSCTLDASLDATLRAALERHIARDEPHDIEPHVSIRFAGTLLDGVDFVRLATTTPDDVEQMAPELLAAALGRATVEVDLGGHEHGE